MTTPRPGRRVRGSATGRPLMAALDLLGRRWALRILWELRGNGLTFRALRDACDGVSPTVLNTRLGELREAALVESTPDGYAVTDLGQQLCAALAPLQQWAQRWAKQAPPPTARRTGPA